MLRALMLGHAVLDWLSGILLMIWPGVVAALTPDGFVWSHYGYRTFGAALLAVGTASYLASKYTERERLRDVMLWKSVWAGSVILGMLLTFASQQQPLPVALMIILLIFMLGFALWFSFYMILQSSG
jgi:hypothetical protein